MKDETQKAGSTWRGTGRTLVVDDEAGVRSVAAAMLTSLGFTVTTTTNGSEGLMEFQKDPASFALVLLDLTMPVMDCEEAFRRMRAKRPGAKVILMSGFNQQEANARFIGRGLAGFVQKPFDFESMAAEVQRAFIGK